MKKTQRLRVALLISLISLPATAFGQASSVTAGLGTLNGLVTTFTSGIVSSLVALFATMAMAAFFWGIAQFIWGSREGKPDVMTNGKNFMLWGLIALFVMFSVWGIIIYVQNIFGIQGNTIKIPRIEINNSTSVSPASPTGLPSGGNASGCTAVNASCTVNGQAGHCEQGSASQAYALYCVPGTVVGNNCAAITDASTCQQMSCSWSNADNQCSP
jgi:hypothetical protein